MTVAAPHGPLVAGVAAFVFDLGNVVCDFVPERRLTALATAVGRSEAEVHDALWGGPFSDDCDTGRLGGPESHEVVARTLGFGGSYDELADIWALAFAPEPAVLALVDAVRALAPTALLTDNPEILYDALPRVLPEVVARFDRVFFSFQLGTLKPDPKVFDHVTGVLGCEPGQVLFVDDSARNVEGARAAGWRAVQFTGAAALATELGAAP